jgi:DNA-binding SARP family transcriptional activator
MTEDEIRSFVHFRGHTDISPEIVTQLHKQFDGWITGLVLWLEQSNVDNDPDVSLYPEEREVVFSYFANEIFKHTEPEVQDFVLKTSCLPFVNFDTAALITGNDNAEDILLGMVRNNYFISRSGRTGYRYHQLFRDFLVEKAQTEFGAEKWRQHMHHAAEVMSQAGYTQESITLAIKTADWPFVASLIIGEAPSLLLQGRNTTLLGWMKSIPQETVTKIPWLMFWSGMACLMLDPFSARKILIKTYYLFLEQQDSAGLYSAWSGIVDSYILGMDNYSGLDDWFDEYDRIKDRFSMPPVPEIETRLSTSMMSGLVMRRPWHAEIESWIERAVALSRQSGDISLRVHCLFFAGYFDICYRAASHKTQINAELDALYQDPGATAMAKIRILLFKLFFFQYELYSSPSTGDELIENAMSIAEQSGVVILNHMLLGNYALAKIAAFQLDRVADVIDKMAGGLTQMGPWDQAFYNFLIGAFAWTAGDVPRGVSTLHYANKLNEPLGECSSKFFGEHLEARALIDHGDLAEARIILDRVWEFVRKINQPELIQEINLTEAFFAMRQQDDEKAEYFLREFFEYENFKQIHFGRIFFWRINILKEIIVRALEFRIAESSIAGLIHQYGEILGEPPVYLDNWPWPLKIYTLGRFNILKDSEPLRFSGKAQNKPLDLLKAIIAFGGRDVSEEKLTEALWPDADGDLAHRNFDTNVHRLRKIIGTEAIKVSERKVTLDPKYCWVDTWAFERQLSEINTKLAEHSDDVSTIKASVERVRKLYQNHFLSSEAENSWSLSQKERLRQRWLLTLKKLVKYYGRNHLCSESINLYEHALILDDLAEDMYRGLMGCYAAQGKRAEALSVYQRCEDALKNIMQIEPADSTRKLFDAIQKGDTKLVEQHCDNCRGLITNN